MIRQSNRVRIRQLSIADKGRVKESEPPEMLGPNEVIVLQPYGSLFFAAAPVFEQQLPTVEAGSSSSVVILRLRGRSDLGSTFMEVLSRYARSLHAVGSKLVIISGDDQLNDQFGVTGVTDLVGEDNIYMSDEWVGETLRRAYADAIDWVGAHRSDPEAN